LVFTLALHSDLQTPLISFLPLGHASLPLEGGSVLRVLAAGQPRTAESENRVLIANHIHLPLEQIHGTSRTRFLSLSSLLGLSCSRHCIRRARTRLPSEMRCSVTSPNIERRWGKRRAHMVISACLPATSANLACRCRLPPSPWTANPSHVRGCNPRRRYMLHASRFIYPLASYSRNLSPKIHPWPGSRLNFQEKHAVVTMTPEIFTSANVEPLQPPSQASIASNHPSRLSRPLPTLTSSISYLPWASCKGGHRGQCFFSTSTGFCPPKQAA
jgi:hypothetical protein